MIKTLIMSSYRNHIQFSFPFGPEVNYKLIPSSDDLITRIKLTLDIHLGFFFGIKTEVQVES